jgi:class 3 adenylate cyclase/tetratricopeptide (TPR) repeat protein
MRCPRCDAENPAGMRFCGQCGAALGDPALSSRPEGELKQVTILFCDMVDSTPLAERLGPEAMHELVRGFIDRALDEVHRYEGTAPQFSGDGFMALFGAPVAHEDHVHRALLAALAIQRAVGAEGGGERVAVRIGIHSGLVVFGAVGARLNMDPTAIGDAANLAARLQTAAAPGTIVISDDTWRLAQGYAQAAPLGPLLVKGKTEPIRAWRLTGYSDRRTALDAAAASRIRDFVGRARELAALDAVARQVAGGHGRIIGLCGEPGIGKSRLLAEFRRAHAGFAWLEGRCFSYGPGIPYRFVLDLVREQCGIADADPPQTATQKVRAGLRLAGMTAEEEAAPLLHLLGLEDIGGLSGNPNTEQQKERTFAILRRLHGAAAAARPLVLALEDLQWIDKASEEYLLSLTGMLPGAGILLVATYRGDYRPPWAGNPLAAELALEPLSDAESARVVRSVLGDAPLTPAIVAKGDGNPFFLEQLALHAGENAAPGGDEAVPNTVHDVVMARIDRLPRGTKRLLQVAAVIGREFSHRLVDAVWPGPDAIEPHLKELLRLDFIHRRPPGERPGYVFHHALTQETASSSLLARHRRHWHGRVAAALEGFFRERAEDAAERLALHYGRSDEAEKAVDYAIMAAEKSQRRWANAEALSYFENALARLDAMPDTPANRLRRVDAVLKQAEVKFVLGRQTEHIAALEGIRDIVDTIDDPRRRATWHYWVGFLHSFTGASPAIAVSHCRNAADIAAAAGFVDLDGYISSCLAHVYVMGGELRAAIEAGERALALFEAEGNLWWAGRTLWQLASAALYLGEWERSLEYCRRGLAHGATLNDMRLKIVGLYRSGSALIQKGEIALGLRYCDEALSLGPDAYDTAFARTIRGYGLIKAGQIDAGIAELTDAIDWLDQSHLLSARSAPALRLAEGYLRRGDAEIAVRLAEAALANSRSGGNRYLEGLAHRLIAECIALDAAPAAEAHLDEALRIFDSIGARNDLARAIAVRAGLRHAAGALEEARRLRAQANRIFRELGTRDETVEPLGRKGQT